eukprot:9109351-Pyramimonas_sp.AAC.1
MPPVLAKRALTNPPVSANAECEGKTIKVIRKSCPGCTRAAPLSTRAPRGHYTLIKPLHHWRIQFSPQIFADDNKVHATRQ